MSTVTIGELIGKQTRVDTLASTDTKALTVYTIISTPPRIWYQVWNHGMQVVLPLRLAKP
jgi:hypothetical protein